jgi:hypothetical protein
MQKGQKKIFTLIEIMRMSFEKSLKLLKRLQGQKVRFSHLAEKYKLYMPNKFRKGGVKETKFGGVEDLKKMKLDIFQNSCRKRTAELWIKKRFVIAILFVELEIVSNSTISVTLRGIYKSCPSSTGPLALMV